MIGMMMAPTGQDNYGTVNYNYKAAVSQVTLPLSILSLLSPLPSSLLPPPLPLSPLKKLILDLLTVHVLFI
jgi:hypothetical protein